MMVAGWVHVNVAVDLGIDKVNRIFRVDESADKIGTESEAIDLAESVYTRKVDSPKFLSRLWLAQVIRYPQGLRGMFNCPRPLMMINFLKQGWAGGPGTYIFLTQRIT